MGLFFRAGEMNIEELAGLLRNRVGHGMAYPNRRIVEAYLNLNIHGFIYEDIEMLCDSGCIQSYEDFIEFVEPVGLAESK